MKGLQPSIKVYSGLAKVGKTYRKVNGVKLVTSSWAQPVDPTALNSKLSVQRSRHFVQNFIPHRIANGPFKARGDVQANSPAGWARVLSKTSSFQSASVASFLETTSATDLGAPIPTTAIGDSVVLAREDHRDYARNAALYCLNPNEVTNPTRIAIKQKLATILKNQVAHAKFDARNTVHFVRGAYSDDGSNFWQVCYIVLNLLMLYDDVSVIVNEQDFDAFTPSEKVEIDSWFAGWHAFLESLFAPQIVKAFPGFYTDSYTSVDRQYTPNTLYWQRNGDGSITTPTCLSYQRFLNNRRGFYKCFQLFYSAKYGLGNGRQDAYRWIYHILRFATYPDGTYAEEHRLSTGEPAEGILYTSATVDECAWMIDLAAKQGWMEFYNDFYVNGVTAGLNGTSSGSPKTLKTLITSLGNYAKSTLPTNRYASLTAAQTQNSAQRIRLYNVENLNLNFRIEYGACILSALAKDTDIENIHLRSTAAGYVADAANQQGLAVNDPDVGFRGLHASMFFEYGARGGAWHPVTNPCDYPTLWASAY